MGTSETHINRIVTKTENDGVAGHFHPAGRAKSRPSIVVPEF